MKVSFEEIGSVVASFYAVDTVKAGQAVGLSGAETVGTCIAGKRVCGVALSDAKGGAVGIQVAGFATLHTSGTEVTQGWVALTGDGSGGVKKAGTGDESGTYLVVSADTAAGTAVVLL